MTNEAQILTAVLEVHTAVGRLEGTTNAILDEQQTQNQRIGKLESSVSTLNRQQAVDEHAQQLMGGVAQARRSRRQNLISGAWIAVAAVLGATTGPLLHAVGLA